MHFLLTKYIYIYIYIYIYNEKTLKTILVNYAFKGISGILLY